MTDRHSGYIVVLESDIREDDSQNVINAIRMIKGVISVDPIISNVEIHIAKTRVKLEIAESLNSVLFSENTGDK